MMVPKRNRYSVKIKNSIRIIEITLGSLPYQNRQ